MKKIITATLAGLKAIKIYVEVFTSRGLPEFSIVGLPSATVKEARKRVEAAIKSSGFDMPLKKITVNLAPADIKKEGSHFDLPIALGVLTSINNTKDVRLNTAFFGELGLDGSIKPVRGILPMVDGLKAPRYIIPEGNAEEVSVLKNVEIYKARTLIDVYKWINCEKELDVIEKVELKKETQYEDFLDIKSNYLAKIACAIAAAGWHNMLMIGPPGAGKTMLARRIPGILPPMSIEEIIEVTKIYSVAGLTHSIINTRPFRNPHHTASDVSLIGGGKEAKPGEVSLAHKGVLFLDELPEFHRDVLEALRQPLEDKFVSISRANIQVVYPSDFLFVAAMNPCPCGFFGSKIKECVCSAYAVQKYRNKISGPLLDRIDIHIEVGEVEVEKIISSNLELGTKELKEKVLKAHEYSLKRNEKYGFKFNGNIPPKLINEICKMEETAYNFLKEVAKKFAFTNRTIHRLMKLARTVADMNEEAIIKKSHLVEAINLRVLDKEIT
ncbi:MAG: YifB family Mg chelatase-like AAA ATPase [bacterium]|nr:YifB family Mg chelatase-like AAA ATPase [bacterium]